MAGGVDDITEDEPVEDHRVFVLEDTDPRGISENEIPNPGFWGVQSPPFDPEKHKAGIQKLLAISLVGINCVAVFALIWSVFAGILTVSEALQLSAVMGSFQGLAGAAVGFYFAKELSGTK